MINDSELLVSVDHLSKGRMPAFDASELPAGALYELLNYVFTPSGGVRKRPGQKLHSASAGTGSIRALARYWNRDYQPPRTIYAADGSLKRMYGTSSIATIQAGFLSDEWDFAVRRGILYGTNKTDGLISYDGGETGGVQKYPDATKAGCMAINNGIWFLGDLEGAPDVLRWSSGEAGNIRFPSTYWAATAFGESDQIMRIAVIALQVFVITRRGVFILHDSGDLAYIPVHLAGSKGMAAKWSLAKIGDGGIAYLAEEAGELKVVVFDGHESR